MSSAQSETEDARVPIATVLASIAGLWLCYFVLTTLRWQLYSLGSSLDLLWPRALVSLAGVVITLALWLVLRLFDARPLWAKIAAALLLSLPVSIVLAQANQLLFSDVQSLVYHRIEQTQGQARDSNGDLLGDMPVDVRQAKAGQIENAGPMPASTWQDITEIAFGRYFMMLAWCALYLALLTGEKARAAERREGTFRRAAKAAELRSLRYQVNPHFLFNTLNSLSALVLTSKTGAAEQMIQSLSAFYRRSLADDPTSDVPLREEFELQQLYLDIEAVRFPSRLRVRYQLPNELADLRVPGMILQPLVENSVKHAVAPVSRQVTVTLAARTEYGQLVLTVSDDGPGAADPVTRRGFGIGLANVRERLEARFGAEASVVSGPVPGGYATVLRLPILTRAEGRP
jgi:two-component system LytT family sensor kinase